MRVAAGSTDVSTLFDLGETPLTITDLDLYYTRVGSDMSSKADCDALANAHATHTDNSGYEVGGNLYRIDWPDEAFAIAAPQPREVVLTVKLADGTFVNQSYELNTVAADVVAIGGAAQSATDLKDFADTGYDPSTHKAAGIPNAAAGAKGGLPILDADTGLIVTGHGPAPATILPTGLTQLVQRAEPDNTGIGAIQTVTDKLAFGSEGQGPTYDVKATLDSETVQVSGLDNSVLDANSIKADALLAIAAEIVLSLGGADFEVTTDSLHEIAAAVGEGGVTVEAIRTEMETGVGALLPLIEDQTSQLQFAAGRVLADATTLETGYKVQTYTVVDSRGAAISDCHVLVTSEADGSGFIAAGYTDSQGYIRFIGQLSTEGNPVTYYMWRTKQGYDFTNPDTEVMPLV